METLPVQREGQSSKMQRIVDTIQKLSKYTITLLCIAVVMMTTVTISLVITTTVTRKELIECHNTLKGSQKLAASFDTPYNPTKSTQLSSLRSTTPHQQHTTPIYTTQQEEIGCSNGTLSCIDKLFYWYTCGIKLFQGVSACYYAETFCSKHQCNNFNIDPETRSKVSVSGMSWFCCSTTPPKTTTTKIRPGLFTLTTPKSKNPTSQLHQARANKNNTQTTPATTSSWA
ncbi:small hydrophobic protein [Gull metapneumovirus]|nr:small hydrophobic protein [Gull metapneumovirus]